jgi:hypothetical protein
LSRNQRIAGGRIGNAQQRFSEAHQRDAFLAGERELLHQFGHAAGLVAGTHPVDQLRCGFPCLARRRGRQRRGVEQRRDAFGLGPAIGGSDRAAQRRLRPDGRGEIGEGKGRLAHLRNVAPVRPVFRLFLPPEQVI